MNSVFIKLLYSGVSYQKFVTIRAAGHELSVLATATPQQLQKFSFTEEQIHKWQTFDDKTLQTHLTWLAESHNHLLTIDDPAYPVLLKSIYDPPLALFVKGDVMLLNQLQLAIVGSRNPTAVGKEIAFDFAKHLSELGIAITSGMATGIDAASHRGALAANGKTIAVCGTGLDRVYPARHRELAQQIAEHGALVSEFLLGVGPEAFHFPKRNRIISGLSLGTLVVEAALQSGSLITARQALEQGREVFAVPGSIHNPLARGCHRLIRDGAKLVETAADVLEELSQLANIRNSNFSKSLLEKPAMAPILDPDYQNLLACIGFETTAVDVIVAQAQLPANQVASMLLILELNSYITAQTGGYVRLK